MIGLIGVTVDACLCSEICGIDSIDEDGWFRHRDRRLLMPIGGDRTTHLEIARKLGGDSAVELDDLFDLAVVGNLRYGCDMGEPDITGEVKM